MTTIFLGRNLKRVGLFQYLQLVLLRNLCHNFQRTNQASLITETKKGWSMLRYRPFLWILGINRHSFRNSRWFSGRLEQSLTRNYQCRFLNPLVAAYWEIRSWVRVNPFKDTLSWIGIRHRRGTTNNTLKKEETFWAREIKTGKSKFNLGGISIKKFKLKLRYWVCWSGIFRRLLIKWWGKRCKRNI